MQADLAGTSATIRGTAAPALAGRSVLLFAVQLVPLFALSVWVYSSAIPVWGAWVMGGVNASYRAWSVPLEVHSTDVSGEIHARVLLSGGRSEPLVVDRTPETVFVSLILLPSLILATPIALRRRVMLLSIGLAAGVGIALLCARASKTLLFGLEWYDPGMLALTAFAICASGLAAASWPTVRAAAVEPSQALREY